MATSTIDGIVEEAVLKRHGSTGSLYERIKFRLDDGSTRTWAKAHVATRVAELLAPGTRGRFYLFTAIDHRGISGVRTADGREGFGVSKLNETIGLWLAIVNVALTLVYVFVLEGVQILALILIVLGIAMFILYRQNRREAEKAFRADAGFRPAAGPA